MLRIILIFLIIFLIVRAFVITGLESREEKKEPERRKNPEPAKKKGVPKELGEYVEYEEVNKKD